MEGSSKRRTKGTTLSARGGDERRKPLPLPEGAWAKWGKHAVYFASPIREGGHSCVRHHRYSNLYQEVGLGVYAINPADLSIYHVVDFTRMADSEIYDASVDASFAVFGSRVYVATSKYVWFYEIGGGGGPVAEWKKGPKFNGRHMFNAKLFTFKGCLYAICLLVEPDCFANHNFQMLFRNKGWLSLDDPPAICTAQVEREFLNDYNLLGISCIEDIRVILHVCTRHRVPYYLDDENISTHHFLCYEPKDGFNGEWTRINIDEMDQDNRSIDWMYQDICPPYRFHLLSDDPFVLVPYVDPCEFVLQNLDHPMEMHSINLGWPIRIHSLIIIQVDGSYRVIAFSKPPEPETEKLAITRPKKSAGNWGDFFSSEEDDLEPETAITASLSGYDASESKDDDLESVVDFVMLSFDVECVPFRRINMPADCVHRHYSGLQLPVHLFST